jgi:hypothetical protein
MIWEEMAVNHEMTGKTASMDNKCPMRPTRTLKM